MLLVKFSGIDFTHINIKFKYYDSFNNKLIKEKEIFVDNNYILNQLPLNGLLEKR